MHILFFFLILACNLQFSSETETSKFFKFSNQEDPLLITATNFATLKSEDLGHLPESRFTICGSIYIGFYRSYQTFYTLRRNYQDKLWFSLTINNQNTAKELYTTVISYFGGSVFPNMGAKLRLRPHAWSHACTTVDVKSGHVVVVINGILTHNTTISSKDFTDNVPLVFQNKLVLGIRQEKFKGAPNSNRQSEASVTNVNVFSVPLNLSHMVANTTAGRWTDGDIVSWSQAAWTLSGNVQEVNKKGLGKTFDFPNLFIMADGFKSWSDCMNLCPRIKAGGRVPLTSNVSDAQRIAQIFFQADSKASFWSPFRYQGEGTFIDHYTGSPMDHDMWVKGQPNGGLEQQCTEWDRNNPKGMLYDLACNVGIKRKCLCQFDESPILRIRGLCQESKIDTHLTLKSDGEGIAFMGLTGTVIKFLRSSSISEWTINVTLEKTIATTSATETSFILGVHSWVVKGDSPECNMGNPYTSQLKLSGCKTDGEFTCDDGQCVTMEQRCDQVPDCRDKSDERGCKMLVTEEGYNKGVPPFTVNSTDRSIVPVKLNISIDLLKIVDIEETDHKIDFQFEITLEWRENNRVVYHNLKQDASLNALSTDDIDKLWLPLVIYDNTDQKEMTRLGAMWEWNTPISVIREGSFTRSGLEVVDETEIFQGAKNILSMQQVYTWQFQCKYNLQDYPFDTQV